jgi:predicted Zn-dependent protease
MSHVEVAVKLAPESGRPGGQGFYRGAPGRRALAAERPRGSGWRGLALGLLLLAPGCTTVPVTGRSAFNLVAVEEDKSLGEQAYGEALKDAPLIDSGNQFDLVQRVFTRLVAVTDEPFREDFEWEVRLVDDKQTVNAWCLPGGKMACYRGILPVAKDEAGLAVVMGHEIGHAVARHGTERMSQQLGVQAVIELAAGGTAAQWSEALAVAFFLPWGRKQELEADHIGLIYMARAGYDPRTAKDFWSRMAELSGDDGTPQWLSTHPSDETRIAQIEKLLPTALEEWQEATQAAQPPPSP